MPLNAPQPVGQHPSAPSPTCAPTAIAASALRTLCTPSSGDSNRPNGSPVAAHVEARQRRRDARRRRLPRRAVAEAERLDRADRRRRAAPRACGLSAPSSSRPLRGTRFDQAAERQAHRVEVRVDVGVVELDVVDDGDVGQVLQELRRLVEERAVVLVALDHEVAARADPVARALRRRSSARCRRPAPSDRARRASAATRSATSSSSCRACRRGRSSARPRGSGRESPRAASSSGSCARAPPRARGCRARSRCRRRRDRCRCVMWSAA